MPSNIKNDVAYKMIFKAAKQFYAAVLNHKWTTSSWDKPLSSKPKVKKDKFLNKVDNLVSNIFDNSAMFTVLGITSESLSNYLAAFINDKTISKEVTDKHLSPAYFSRIKVVKDLSELNNQLNLQSFMCRSENVYILEYFLAIVTYNRKNSIEPPPVSKRVAKAQLKKS